MAKAELYIKNGSSWVNYNLLNAYPVGSIYMSYTSTSPASLFGGNWTAITGRFLYCNNGTSTGGANRRTYNFNHNHLQTLGFSSTYGNANGCAYTNGGTVASLAVLTATSDFSVSAPNHTGPGDLFGGSTVRKLGNKTIDTMPAYQTIYCWRRTA